MSCYVVTFEVAAPAARSAVKDRLKKYGTFCPIHEHCWAIVTNDSAVQVRDSITPLIAPTDRVFVVRSGTEAAWSNAYGQKNTDWLKKNL
jgi:hypothetical protein